MDLADAIGHFSDLFDPDALAWATLLDGTTGRRALYRYRWAARPTTSTSGKACWSRRASPSPTSRRSGTSSGHSGAIKSSPRCAEPRVTRTSGASASQCRPLRSTRRPGSPVRGRLRRRLRDPRRTARDRRSRGPTRAPPDARQLHAIYRKGCTPPDSVTWDGPGNNKAFLAQAVVMTPNQSLSIPNALKAPGRRTTTKCHDHRLAGRAPRPAARHRDLRQSRRGLQRRRARRDRQGVRAFPRRRGLAAIISTSPASAYCRRCRSCSTQLFWLDPSDPHRMRSAMQLLLSRAPTTMWLSRATGGTPAGAVWAEAVHRVAADGISPEQAVDEAIARSSRSSA